MTTDCKKNIHISLVTLLLLIVIIALGTSHALGNTLLSAVKAGDLEGVQDAIANGADINTDVRGETALIAASDRGHAEIANILLQQGADINIQGFKKRTPLMVAVNANAFEIVGILLKHGADLDLVDYRKNTALSLAIQKDAVQSARLLLSAGATINETEATDLAIRLAKKGKWETVKLLIEKNIINSNAKTRRGKTFMMLASEQGKIEIIEFLLNYHADISEKILSLALKEKHCDVATFFIEKDIEITNKNENEKTALMEAAASGCVEVVKALINRSADVNRVSIDNRREVTPLLLSVMNSHIDIVKLLLEHGVDTEIEGNPDYYDIGTALIFAIKKNQPIIIKLLLENGADVKAKMKSKTVVRAGKSALFLAIETRNIDIVSTLLKYHVDVSEKIDNEPIVLFALEKKQPEITKLLIDSGACSHISDEDKSKLLMTALETGYFDIAKILILLGADVNAKQYRYKSKKTALIIASKTSHKPNAYEIVRLLIEKGADIDARDRDGNTALHYARDSRIVSYLLTHSENVTESQFISKFDFLDSDAIKLFLEKYDYTNATDKNEETPLMKAANSKNGVEITKLLLEYSADPNKQSNTGVTAMMKAASNSKNGVEITKLLLEYGADPNKQNNTGVTAMMRAAYDANPKIMKVLWEHGADPSIKYHQGKMVIKYNHHHKFEIDRLLEWMQTKKKDPLESLFVGIEYFDIELVQKAVRDGADVNSREQNKRSRFWGFTPFQVAVYYGHIDIVEFLTEQGGADVKSWSPEGNAVVIAVRQGHQKVVKYLIEQGANVRPQFGTSPISVAEERKNSEMIALLQAAGARSSRTLWKAVIENDYKTVKEEMKKGANPNDPIPDYGVCSSLAVAARLNFPDIAELLIKHKADVNARTAEPMFYKQRGTILHGAVYKENENIVKLLIENGANVEAKLDKGMFEGYTPIKIAEEINSVNLTRLLKESGAKTSKQKEERRSELFRAVLSDDLDRVKSLLNDGVDVDAKINKTNESEIKAFISKNKDRYSDDITWLLENFQLPRITPLIVAISQGNGKTANLLLDKGADANTRIIIKGSGYAVTPLLLAAYFDNAEIVQLLIAHRADIHDRIDSRDLGGKTALRIAVKKKNVEIVQLLLQAGATY